MNYRLRFQLSFGARKALLSERVGLLQIKEEQQELMHFYQILRFYPIIAKYNNKKGDI
jgi:hypothetical protein